MVKHTFIVEHLDPELEEWQILEYNAIASECSATNAEFLLTGLANSKDFQGKLEIPASNLIEQSVETLYASPEAKQRVCLLDPRGEADISPEDADKFDVFLFGGILGDHPPRDRTGELRRFGFPGRRLGAKQMTTDTAARVTRIVVQEKKKLDEIDYVDYPDIEIPTEGGGSAESVNMPFRYVKGQDGKSIMPKGMLDLLAADADKGIADLLADDP
ncbi:Hypothetical protein R9X50_00136500 [Acrodontium crateriforme]|uniref:DUF431 domain-containing protein n=1 Tax=Acrodontium crateriforme TaxID=150365 RepID=A0AAQ3R5S0_9PEZI|nr:Hypothetical protein R9X50_00136500 [Acrodontium crateriforme]